MLGSRREDDLKSAQKDQKNVGKASSDPETAEPIENLREREAEMTTNMRIQRNQLSVNKPTLYRIILFSIYITSFGFGFSAKQRCRHK